MSFIRAKIDVKKVKWDEQKVAAALAKNPVIQSRILAKADRVASTARSRIAAAPRQRVTKTRHKGHYFSEKPSAIAKTVDVKQAAPLIVATTSRGAQMPVALVVADHPYSRYYKSAFGSAVLANAGGGWKFQKNSP